MWKLITPLQKCVLAAMTPTIPHVQSFTGKIGGYICQKIKHEEIRDRCGLCQHGETISAVRRCSKSQDLRPPVNCDEVKNMKWQVADKIPLHNQQRTTVFLCFFFQNLEGAKTLYILQQQPKMTSENQSQTASSHRLSILLSKERLPFGKMLL